ncbi:MAG TPA: aldo/keto reductase [Homoserinimonas sp.]|nr:aldo/keto reductase [Homoserinimonas sp.]
MTAPIPLLPDAVLPASQSPHSLGLWGRRLGESPVHLFPLALGSGSFGWSVDDRAAADIIERFIDLGGNFVDATGSHADARSERVLGSWVVRRRRRPDILIGTTVGHHHDLSQHPTRIIVQAVDASLGRLSADHLDLLSVQLDGRSQADEVLVAVDDLIRAGKVRFAAAAMPTADQLIEARVIAAQSGVSPLVAVQGTYSLIHRAEYEPEVARVAGLQNSGFMPRQPLAGGLLTGNAYTKQDVARFRRHGVAVSLPPKRWPALANALKTIAAELEVTAPAVALAWLLTRPNVTAPIVSVSNPGQVDDVMAAVRLQLTRQQTSELDRLSR